MSLYSRLAEQLQYISPSFYKARFFRKLRGITPENILERHIEPEMLWIKRQLDKNSVILDVGANVGAYLYLLEEVANAKKIYAFEPNPQLYGRLRRLFPLVNVFPLALSNKNGTETFKIPVVNGETLNSRGTLQSSFREENETSSKMQNVQVNRLDDLDFIQNLTKIDFIKVDVEGHEAEMLQGAIGTIKKFKPVLMVEIEQRHHERPVWEIITQTEQAGYTAHYLDRQTLEPVPLTREIVERQDAANVKNHGNYINNIVFLPV